MYISIYIYIVWRGHPFCLERKESKGIGSAKLRNIRNILDLIHCCTLLTCLFLLDMALTNYTDQQKVGVAHCVYKLPRKDLPRDNIDSGPGVDKSHVESIFNYLY